MGPEGPQGERGPEGEPSNIYVREGRLTLANLYDHGLYWDIMPGYIYGKAALIQVWVRLDSTELWQTPIWYITESGAYLRIMNTGPVEVGHYYKIVIIVDMD